MPLLEDVSVVSLAVNLPGPAAAQRLRTLGARVRKVEPPSGDIMAAACPNWYTVLTQGIDVCTLDLKSTHDRAALEPMLADADLLITATRPAALDRLGLDWPALHARFPQLCHVAIVGYPPPSEDVAGHDLTYQAKHGLVQPPDMPRALVADLAGAERAATEALALLYARIRTGESGRRLVALSEAAEAMAAALHYGATTPGAFLGGGLANYNLYETQSGWLAVAALEPHFYARLSEALGLQEPDAAALAEAFQTRTAAEWETWAAEHGLPLCACRTPGT